MNDKGPDIYDYKEEVELKEEEKPVSLPIQEEFFKMPKKFGTVPDVEKAPIKWSSEKGYLHLFPRLRLPFQRIDTISLGSKDIEPNRLYWGDNLHIMRMLPSESIDLIYIDPPFFSGRNYNVVFGDHYEVMTFEDIWDGGIPTYLTWLNARLVEMKRLLKPNGSIYVHLDWHACHYVKVEMDKIFGHENFINEIIWQRTTNPKGSQFKAKKYGQATDSILFYSKTSDYRLNISAAKRKLNVDELREKYKNIDEKGPFYPGPIVRPIGMGPRPNLVYEYKGYTPPPSGWRLSKGKLLELDKNGDMGWSKNEKPFRKLRPSDDDGEPLYNLWTDISRLYGGNPEVLGYPTQKPEALLERIIKVSSNEGDVVADFFCGGGTTPTVAHRLGRRWVASDISRIAIEITKGRILRLLKTGSGMLTNPGKVPNIEVLSWGFYDVDRLKESGAEEFKEFVVRAFGGRPISGEKPINGIKNGLPILVGSNDPKSAVNKNDVLNFAKYMNENYELRKTGIILAWSFSDDATGARDALAALGGDVEFVKIKTVRIGSEDFIKENVGSNEELRKVFRFVFPPQVILHIEGGDSREYIFDFSDSASLNNGRIINIQADFDFDGRFAPTEGYAFNPEKLVLKYRFDFGGTRKVAFKIEDDQGGEKLIVREMKI